MSEKTRFEKIATNEVSLALYRLITGGGAILMTFWMHSLLTGNDDIRQQVNALNFKVSNQITALTGRMDSEDIRVDAQSRRMDGFQADLRDTNNRLNDYLVYYPTYHPSPSPPVHSDSPEERARKKWEVK